MAWQNAVEPAENHGLYRLTSKNFGLDKYSAVLGLVQDEPALRAGAASGILDKTCARRLCRRQVGSEEWSA